MQTLLYTILAIVIGGYYLWLSRSITDPVRRNRQRWLAWMLIGGSLVVLLLTMIPT